MPEDGDPLDPFLKAVSEQLRRHPGATPAPSSRELERLLWEAGSGRHPRLLHREAILSSFFANLDLLPPMADPRVDTIIRLVRAASDDSSIG